MAQETIPTDGWVKSSFCESSGCVEVNIIDGLEWAKSSFCESNGCVEIAILPVPPGAPATPGALEFARDETGDWLLRSTAHPDTVLRYTPEEWDVFTRGVRNGEFTRRG